MNFDKPTCGLALKLLSTVSSGMFAGGAMYITMVEGPARMTHDAASAITMWKPSFNRAKGYQKKLALLSAFSAFGAYGCLRSETNSAFEWLGAGTAILSILPITLVFIVPLNDQLVETEKCISVKGDEWIVQNLNQWDKLHSIRSLVSFGAFSFMLYTLTK